MSRRTDLHEILCDLMGSRNVYFQPPETIKMVYPCIVYERSRINTIYANGKPYTHSTQYTLTVVDRNPDSLIPRQIAALPLCRFDRHFTNDTLNHDVFTIYY